MKKVNVAVFISGSGTDLQSLIDAQAGVLQHGQIAFVLSSSANAYGIVRAQNNNIPTLCLNEKQVGNDIFYSTLERYLRKYSIDLIVLAGYLPILSESFVARWCNKIINIHPSLLPKYGGKGFYGLKVHQAVLDSGDKFTGATIHYVTKDLDMGEIIAQENIAVDVDTAEELQIKVLREVEWKLLPQTVESLCAEMLVKDIRKLNVAIIGSGGREHALARKISESPLVKDIICISGNDGIVEAENIEISLNNFSKIINVLQERHVGLCVVGPEMPLACGLADCIRDAGICCFGPSKMAAKIEYSKIFAKNLMKKYHIPTAAFAAFDEYDDATQYVKNSDYPIVIKADGLCGGKGVFVCENQTEANIGLNMLMKERIFGESGARVIIEECLSGVEISVMVLTDGKHFVLLPSAKDYKKAFDEDKGPNTGSMGAIAPHPIWSEQIQKECICNIIEPTLLALQKEKLCYSGCLYFGLMLTEQGLKVLEYNCRFGDPETEVVLPLIESDIVPLLIACATNDLINVTLRIKDDSCCAVVLACEGYPYKFQKGVPLSGIINNNIICSGVKSCDNGFAATGGRVVCAVGLEKTTEIAVSSAYKVAEQIYCRGLFYRKDIGT